MDWRVAKSLLRLRDQINAMAPNRSTISDGTIGDANHATTNSDHNPWIKDPPGPNVVSAMDITHDPAHGADAQKIVNNLVASRDKRIKYIIWNRRIISSTVSPWVWRPYTGSNPHDHHFHLSVMPAKSLYDDISTWRIKATKTQVRYELWAARPDPVKITESGWATKGTAAAKARRAAFRTRVTPRIVQLAFNGRRPFIKTETRTVLA
jgi:hypothetical protein